MERINQHPNRRASICLGLFLILSLNLSGCIFSSSKTAEETPTPTYQQDIIRLAEQVIPTLGEFLLYNEGYINSLNNSAQTPVVKEDRYLQIVNLLARTIFDLNEQLLSLKPPSSQEPLSKKLVSALDKLTFSANQLMEFKASKDMAQLKSAFESVQQGRDQLKDFANSLPQGDDKTRLTEKLTALGVVNISGESAVAYILYLGPFVEKSAATEVAKAIPGSTVSDSPPYRVTVGTFKSQAEADSKAVEFQKKKYMTHVFPETTYLFSVQVETPPTITLWEEPVWKTGLGWSGKSAVAVSANGELVVTGSSDGNLKGIDSDGKSLWLDKLTTPATALAVSGDGGSVVAANSQVFVVSGSGQISPSSPLVPAATVVTAEAGDTGPLAVQTDPKLGQGKIYLIDSDGALLSPWPSGDDVNAVSFDVQPNGEHVLVGSNSVNAGQLIVYTPGGERVHPSNPTRPFAMPALIDKVLLTSSGAYSIVLAGGNIYCYDNAKESLMWSKPAEGRMLALGGTTDKIVTGGSGRFTAYDLVGNKLWDIKTTDCRGILAGQSHFVLQSGLNKIEVYDFSGEKVGEILSPTDLTSVALSSSGQIIVAATDDNSASFWRLP